LDKIKDTFLKPQGDAEKSYRDARELQGVFSVKISDWMHVKGIANNARKIKCDFYFGGK
jgi:hypothetical protein